MQLAGWSIGIWCWSAKYWALGLECEVLGSGVGVPSIGLWCWSAKYWAMGLECEVLGSGVGV